MPNPNEYAKQLQQNKILTASPAELILMLYEGAIKFCNIALEKIEKKDYEGVNFNIQRADNIIVELITTLDKSYEVSKDFEFIYVYIHKCLIEANIKKEKEPLEEGINQLRTIRETWKQVMAKTGKIRCNNYSR